MIPRINATIENPNIFPEELSYLSSIKSVAKARSKLGKAVIENKCHSLIRKLAERNLCIGITQKTYVENDAGIEEQIKIKNILVPSSMKSSDLGRMLAIKDSTNEENTHDNIPGQIYVVKFGLGCITIAKCRESTNVLSGLSWVSGTYLHLYIGLVMH